MRVLIVDDSDDQLERVRLGLEAMGNFEVETARTGRELLTKIIENDWAAILLDVNLLGELGTELARKVLEENPKQPMAFLTAYGGERIRDSARMLGVPVWDKVEMTDIPLLIQKLNEITRTPQPGTLPA